MTIYGAHHLKTEINWMKQKRGQSRRGLTAVEEYAQMEKYPK